MAESASMPARSYFIMLFVSIGLITKPSVSLAQGILIEATDQKIRLHESRNATKSFQGQTLIINRDGTITVPSITMSDERQSSEQAQKPGQWVEPDNPRTLIISADTTHKTRDESKSAPIITSALPHKLRKQYEQNTANKKHSKTIENNDEKALSKKESPKKGTLYTLLKPLLPPLLGHATDFSLALVERAYETPIRKSKTKKDNTSLSSNERISKQSFQSLKLRGTLNK